MDQRSTIPSDAEELSCRARRLNSEFFHSSMYKNYRITIVIPCLNEEEGVGRVLKDMPSFVDEVIVVDNGSTDQTAVVAWDFSPPPACRR
jgi:cellulose synthase/poly-beta-1,6-N-acetylglucosamine synthase-like glycosyltransferase